MLVGRSRFASLKRRFFIVLLEKTGWKQGEKPCRIGLKEVDCIFDRDWYDGTWIEIQIKRGMRLKDRVKRAPGRPRRSDLEGTMDTEQKILCEAAGLFLKSGYAAVSISMITDAVGITKPTLYHYFPDKETLFAAVVCKKLELAGTHIQRGIAKGGSVRQRLICLATGFFHYASMSMQPLMRDVDEQLRPDLTERVHLTLHRAIVKPLQDLIQEGVEQGEVRAQAEQIPMLVELWLGMLDTLAKHCRKETDAEEIGRLAEMAVTVFMDGIAKEGRHMRTEE